MTTLSQSKYVILKALIRVSLLVFCFVLSGCWYWVAPYARIHNELDNDVILAYMLKDCIIRKHKNAIVSFPEEIHIMQDTRAAEVKELMNEWMFSRDVWDNPDQSEKGKNTPKIEKREVPRGTMIVFFLHVREDGIYYETIDGEMALWADFKNTND